MDEIDDPPFIVQLPENEPVPPTAELAFSEFKRGILDNYKKIFDKKAFRENPSLFSFVAIQNRTQRLIEYKLTAVEASEYQKHLIDMLNERDM